MPLLDRVVTAVWVGGLVLFLLARAVLSWWKFRYATKSALYARRLSEATAPAPQAEVLQFRRKSPAAPAGIERGAGH